MSSAIVPCPNCGKRNRLPAAASGHPRCASCRTNLPWIVDASDGDFAEVAESATVPVIVDLWASWCGPCRMVSPVLEQLATEKAGSVKLVKVDIDKSPELARRFAVQAVPTLLVLHKGEIRARQAGAAPVGVLREWFDNAVSTQARS